MYITKPYSLTEESETTNLVSRMDMPPAAAERELINKTIKDLKWWGIWHKFELLIFFNLHTQASSLLNWISSSYDGVAYGTPTWDAKLGFTGNRASMYIRCGAMTGFTKINGYNYSFGTYVNDHSDNTSYVCGWGPPAMSLLSPHISNSFIAYVNTGGSDSALTLGATATSQGMFVGEKASWNKTRCLRNGVPYSWVNLPANSYTFSASRYMDFLEGYGVYCGNQLSMGFLGQSMTDLQHLKFYEIVKYFNDNVGGTF